MTSTAATNSAGGAGVPMQPAPGGSHARFDVAGTPRITFGRLVAVEWRKMLDTRAGFWLLLLTGVLLLIAVGLTLLVVGLNDFEISANDVSQILTIPLSLLLPVFPITSVTSEWSQRSGLVTFTLEPHRLRVLLAKLTAVVLLALSTIVIAIALGALTTVIAANITGNDVRWELEGRTLGLLVLSQLLYFGMAFALATLLLYTPASIAVFYVVALLLPFMVYSVLYGFFEWARDLIPWIDLQFAFAPFLDSTQNVGAKEIGQLSSAIFLWIVLPGVLGMRRVLRAEPK